ncbi:MAG: nucleoside-diphosphate kinase [Treponema sp.]|nr:nucleoside-diphosphate kinase [Treponema sp.]
MSYNKCFTMLKPGILNRRLVGEVISRLEHKGLKLVGLKLMQITPEQAAKHYAEHQEKPFFSELTDYITSGPVVAMVWQGDDCVTLVRKLTGSTKPTEAMPGTIRGDYCMHTQCNVIHASDSEESAEREVNLFFKPEEIVDWEDEAALWY